MDLKIFLLISFILFTLGLGGIFLTSQILRIEPVNPAQPELLRKQSFIVPGWSIYADEINPFTIQHPVAISPIIPADQPWISSAKHILHLSTASTSTIGDLSISRSDDPITGVNIYTSPDRSHCLDSATASSTATIINNIPFKATSYTDAAMGGERGLIREYHTLKDTTCYMLESVVHYRDITFLAGATGANLLDSVSSDYLRQQTDWIEQQQKIQLQIIKTFSFSQ